MWSGMFLGIAATSIEVRRFQHAQRVAAQYMGMQRSAWD